MPKACSAPTGKTFRWSGEYAWDLNTRETRSVALNVFEHFKPALPQSYRRDRFRFARQHRARACNAMCSTRWKQPRFIVADTMDLWIETARPDLDALLPRVDLLILNDSEARQMTKETSLIKAGREIRGMGPKYVAIKKGEHGALLFGENEFFSCGAYPLEDIHDPTGAGDTFAGGMAGYLAANADGAVRFRRPAQSDDLRQRSGELQCRGVQSRTAAQADDGRSE